MSKHTPSSSVVHITGFVRNHLCTKFSWLHIDHLLQRPEVNWQWRVELILVWACCSFIRLFSLQPEVSLCKAAAWRVGLSLTKNSSPYDYRWQIKCESVENERFSGCAVTGLFLTYTEIITLWLSSGRWVTSQRISTEAAMQYAPLNRFSSLLTSYPISVFENQWQRSTCTLNWLHCFL